MPITNYGLEFHVKNTIGLYVDYYNNANTRVGIGNSNDPFDPSQSMLMGDSIWGPLDSGYPTRDPDGDGSGNKIRFKATIPENYGNFRWEEWGIKNDSMGTLHNREVEFLGEKVSGEVWVFQFDITLA